MATKEEREAEAKKHVGLARGVFATEIKQVIEKAQFYEDGVGRELELPEARFEGTEAVVVWGDVATAVLRAKGRVCVVDPMAYRTPGGNYLQGGWSPEAQLCAESTLFPVLEGLKGFYEGNRQSMHGGLYSDRAVYLEDITFTTEGTVKKRDVLAIAPPNRKMALDNHRSEAECAMDLSHRIEALMRISAVHETDTLILGAFGCGALGNDDQVVAESFKAWLDGHPGLFQTVLFVIPGGPSLDVFRAVFPEKIEEEAIEEEAVVEEDQGDEAVDIEPNADGRWVFE